MNFKDYLIANKLSYAKFSKKVGMSKNMIYYFANNIRAPNKTAQLAIEYITIGEVSRKDWECNDLNDEPIKIPIEISLIRKNIS